VIDGENQRSVARARLEVTAKRGATVEMLRAEAAATGSQARSIASEGSGANAAGVGIRDHAVVIVETGAEGTTAGLGTGVVAGGTFEMG
jgi:hypothetical protein